MRKHRGERVPAHLRARRVVALEMVGVQFDQAGDQEVAAHVLAGARRRRRDVGDQAVADRQRAVDDLVGQHDARIVQDQFGRHFRQSFCVVPRLEAAPGMDGEGRSGFRLDEQRHAVDRRPARPARRRTPRRVRRARAALRLQRRGPSASCGSGTYRTRRDSPIGRGCGTPRRSMRRDCGARSRPRSAASGNGRTPSPTSPAKRVERRQPATPAAARRTGRSGRRQDAG